TANALAGNEEMFLAAGFNAFIAKPIDIMRLDVILNQWVRDKQSEETLRNAERELRDKTAAEAKKAGDKPEETIEAFLRQNHPEGLDVAGGIQRYGNGEVYLRILRSYAIHTPELLEKLRGLSRETLPEYAITVHGLKGASYGVCAGGIGREAEALEHAAKAGNYGEVAAENGAFIARTEALITRLEALLRDAAERGPMRQKLIAPDKALLAKLLDGSKHYKSSMMEEAMIELEAHDYESGAELIPWLRKQLDELEYDAIRKRLEAAVNEPTGNPLNTPPDYPPVNSAKAVFHE
ncbi:MAG: hybrid sensor histidine kinase/response regulator, partial [Spirochaetaceae bacterium]|nr:hybrid sensor histidine kinase/response regulator [Spirochaetaceae bacterium]